MNLLDETEHRPFPLPSKRYIMRQTWRNLLFLHWPIPFEKLRPHIPSSLQIDTFNGTAWIGIILFVLEGIYPRGISFISLTPKFPEINVRTYVKRDGKPGIYFMSIDVENWASLKIAKRWYRLPYHSAQISFRKEGRIFHCHSIRKGIGNNSISFEGKYAPVSEVYLSKKGTLDHWLTERYCLFSSKNKVGIYCGEIHHQPWPLQKAEIEVVKNTLFTPFHFDLSEVRPIAYFSTGVDSLMWNIRKVRF
ncbi:YqjF family protein [Camelliibacillus cellulosilyticus]|uniref:YqjF family protein n=1 Tax=Camelliibacillus cellulosilyticus TaxID=2174486 RepID=A0ABV9GQN9_9BACL